MRNVALGIVALVLSTRSPAQADAASPHDALCELEMQLNSRFVTELVGAVDYDFVYYHGGTDAYALAAVQQAQQAQQALPALVDSATRTATSDSAAEGDSLAQAPLWVGAASADTLDPRPAGGAFSSTPTHPEGLAGGGDSTPHHRNAQPRVPLWAGDPRGDPRRFDLAGVDVAALLRHPFPPSLADLEGLTLGVRVCPPEPIASPVVTRIAAEHSVAERREMRLQLRDFYLELPSHIGLKLEAEEVRDEADGTVARIRWWFYDYNARAATPSQSHELRLTRTANGWCVERGWDFLSRVIASR